MRFRVVVYQGVPRQDEAHKFYASERYEYLSDMKGAWNLWYTALKDPRNYAEIYDLMGRKQQPEKGYSGMHDYNP